MMETGTLEEPSRRAIPWVTLTFCLCIIVIHAASYGPPWASAPKGDAAHVISLGAKHAGKISDNESWRMLTFHFLHTSWRHLWWNVGVLVLLGCVLEPRITRGRYLALFLNAAAGAAFLSLICTPNSTLGASGISAGLLGAGVMFGGYLRSRISYWMWLFLIMEIGITASNSNADHWAHIGGMLVGLAIGPLVSCEPRPGSSRVWWIAAIAPTVILLLVAPAIARFILQ